MDKEGVESYLKEGMKLRSMVNADEIHAIGTEIAQALVEKNAAIFIFGNGGSASDAMHMVEEFSCYNQRRHRRPLSAFALTASSPTITAIGNDFGYDEIFARQLRGVAHEGDVVIGLSTSGNSVNVLKGLEEANKLGCFTIALTGKTGGNMRGKADRIIRVDSTSTPLIQEVHMAIGHMLSLIVEDLI